MSVNLTAKYAKFVLSVDFNSHKMLSGLAIAYVHMYIHVLILII